MDGIKCVLLDIEGTVCPISFVKDTLFPYALRALPEVLANKWDAPDFKLYRHAFPEEHRDNPRALQAHVEDLTKRDMKIAYLKNLQGFLWENGYKTGAYSTPLFPDVAPALKQWKDAGYALAIYSSGSVFAQKLLFGHVQVAADDSSATKKRNRPADDAAEDQASAADAPPPSKSKQTTSCFTYGEAVEPPALDGTDTKVGAESGPKHATQLADVDGGEQATDAATARLDTKAHENEGKPREVETEDMTALFNGSWWDTTSAGLKTEVGSYSKIAKSLQYAPAQMLFLSDNVKEVDAAIGAGMKSLLVDRPGNAAVSDTDKERLDIVTSLDQIKLPSKTA
ncbi:hypothetical protein DOTSEDRAFT_51065 [Dothistroma septosporum NZE10]|uniref:Enolase-phosphatase E1 n=1 Tax=Dothistroma septosporum (strain NZE10 / CBS 128990) TaxID=675120 RepID=N1PWF3_DOTSN|nr:hypothetical protein DOTSEDRAFT_51065 [Dothistroma septosporum NZE10]